ncbi:MAG: hypothetical protein WCK27_32580, partial [Verrucomicrobiota bacterium]
MTPEELFWRRLRRSLRPLKRLNIRACLKRSDRFWIGYKLYILYLRISIARHYALGSTRTGLQRANQLGRFIRTLLHIAFLYLDLYRWRTWNTLRLGWFLWLMHVYSDQAKTLSVVGRRPFVNKSDRPQILALAFSDKKIPATPP